MSWQQLLGLGRNNNSNNNPQPQPAFNPQAPNPGQNPQANFQQNPPNPVPNSVQQPAQNGNGPAPAKSPVDMMAELMQNKPQQQGNNNQPGYFDVDPAKIREIASQVKVGQNIPAELQQRASQGDYTAQMQINQLMMQDAIANMMQMSIGISKGGYEHTSKQLRESLPGQINAQTATQQFLQTNPVAKPFADLMVQNLSAQNPGMSASDIAKLAESHFDKFIEAYQQHKNPTPNNPQQAQGGQNWGEFFNLG